MPADRVVDPGGRDGCRAPIPWTAAPDHGWGPRRRGCPGRPTPTPQRRVAARPTRRRSSHLYRRAARRPPGLAGAARGRRCAARRPGDGVRGLRARRTATTCAACSSASTARPRCPSGWEVEVDGGAAVLLARRERSALPDHPAVAPGVLRRVEREVGEAVELVGVARERQRADADRDRHRGRIGEGSRRIASHARSAARAAAGASVLGRIQANSSPPTRARWSPSG